MVLKVERFSHLLGQFFGLGSYIGLRYLYDSNIVEQVTMDISPLNLFRISYGKEGEW